AVRAREAALRVAHAHAENRGADPSLCPAAPRDESQPLQILAVERAPRVVDVAWMPKGVEVVPGLEQVLHIGTHGGDSPDSIPGVGQSRSSPVPPRIE